MIEIGSFIKMQRTKQKMTLGELADGIVSVSYLSKIENLKTEASPHIIQLLCNRLGIELDRTMDDVIEEKCEKWFTLLLDKQNKGKIIELHDELQELLDSNLSDRVLLFEVHKIRYYLYLDEIHLALDQINKLNKMSNSFDTRELYYWYKFRGNYNFESGEYTIAVERYLKAEELSRNLDVPEEELADLQYTMSVAYSQIRNTLEAIAYANQSLSVFMKKYNFIHCARCHIVLGISYRRLKMYDKAIENYNLAKHLAGLNNNQELIQLTNQNLGYLYATQEKYKEAISFYLEIVEDDDVSIQDKIGAITDLIKIYYTMEELTKAKETIDEALKLLEQLPQNSNYDFHYYVLYTYYYSITEQTNQFVTIVKNKFLPFLKKRNDYANTAVFASMLAKHYERIHKYKDATKYYKLSNKSYKELSNI